MAKKPYTKARILVGTGDIKDYDIGKQPDFITAVRAANKVVSTLGKKTVFDVRLVEVR